MNKANINGAALAEWIRLWGLDSDEDAWGICTGVHCDILHVQMKQGGETCRRRDWILRTVEPKMPQLHPAQNIEWSGNCKFKDFQMTRMRSSVIGKRLDDALSTFDAVYNTLQA